MEQRGCSRKRRKKKKKKKGIERFCGEGRGWSSEEIGVICISGPAPMWVSGAGGEVVSPQGFWACLHSSVAGGRRKAFHCLSYSRRRKKKKKGINSNDVWKIPS
ncbi:hypothetical protein CEXT_636981 [Caerostris extrusa]|uniref:Uncharacterized protein n=1 Tax=Caerostris extrusa TaxID=172846 RepID=A0AAV4TAI2_CAEEX|nr:hypothetical protein CEXT_636981 [Caerostris extrusa]